MNETTLDQPSSVRGPSLSSVAALSLHRQRLCGADLRDRLAAAPAACHRRLAGVARRPARHVHGRDVPRQPVPAALHLAAPSPAARVRVPRAGHWRPRAADPVRDAVCDAGVHDVGRVELQPVPAMRRGQPVPAAAHPAHGRDAARDGALGGDDTERRVLARVLLWRQHLRRGGRQSAGRVLSAAPVRHDDRDARRPGPEHSGRARWTGHRQGVAAGGSGRGRGDSRPRERRWRRCT